MDSVDSVAQFDGIVPETESFKNLNLDHPDSITTPSNIVDKNVDSACQITLLNALTSKVLSIEDHLKSNPLVHKNSSNVDNLPMIQTVVNQSHQEVHDHIGDLTGQSYKIDKNCVSSNPASSSTSEKNINDSIGSKHHNQFNQNKFSLACSHKLKFSELEYSLKSKILKNDLPQALSLFFNAILQTVGYAFEMQLPFLPQFTNFTEDTCFHDIFHAGLCGSTYTKCQNIYLRIGDIIKERILHSSCIQKESCPKAFQLIETYNVLEGWDLFEKLIKNQSVLSCGAIADYDLDRICTGMNITTNEKFHQFYQCNTHLLHEYQQQCPDPLQIPTKQIIC